MVRGDGAEAGRGRKGRPTSAATAAIEMAKTRQGSLLRAAVFSGFAYWPRGLLWRVGVAGAEELGGRVLRVGLRLHAAGLVDRIRAILRGHQRLALELLLGDEREELVGRLLCLQCPFGALAALDDPVQRSAEHTSELQSLMRLYYAVFCLQKNKYI